MRGRLPGAPPDLRGGPGPGHQIPDDMEIEISSSDDTESGSSLDSDSDMSILDDLDGNADAVLRDVDAANRNFGRRMQVGVAAPLQPS